MDNGTGGPSIHARRACRTAVSISTAAACRRPIYRTDRRRYLAQNARPIARSYSSAHCAVRATQCYCGLSSVRSADQIQWELSWDPTCLSRLSSQNSPDNSCRPLSQRETAVNYSAADRGAEYCDERVCVFVRQYAITSSELHVRSSSSFCACYLWPWLDPPLAT